MIKITKNNYEAFLLDSLEENLSPEMTAELLLFFENHPELKGDIDDLLFLTPETTIHETKEVLKKGNITTANYEEFLIAEIERENSEKESLSLKEFLQDKPKQQQEFAFYKKTNLIPQPIAFEGKEELKKKGTKVIPLFWWVSSAAAVLLALFLLKGINGEEKVTQKQLVDYATQEVESKEALNSGKAVEEEPEEEFVVEKQAEIYKALTLAKKEEKKNKIESEPENHLFTEELDTLPELIPFEKREESLVAEEMLEDRQQVKITYEDEEVETPGLATNNPVPKKKKHLFRKIFNSQIRDKVREKVMRKEINEDGDVVAYALNIGGVNLYRKKIK